MIMRVSLMRLRLLIRIMGWAGYDYQVVKGPPTKTYLGDYETTTFYEPRAALICRRSTGEPITIVVNLRRLAENLLHPLRP